MIVNVNRNYEEAKEMRDKFVDNRATSRQMAIRIESEQLYFFYFVHSSYARNINV